MRLCAIEKAWRINAIDGSTTTVTWDIEEILSHILRLTALLKKLADAHDASHKVQTYPEKAQP